MTCERSLALLEETLWLALQVCRCAQCAGRPCIAMGYVTPGAIGTGDGSTAHSEYMHAPTIYVFLCVNEGLLACMAAHAPSRSSPALSLPFLYHLYSGYQILWERFFPHWCWIHAAGMWKALSLPASRGAYQLLWGG